MAATLRRGLTAGAVVLVLAAVGGPAEAAPTPAPGPVATVVVQLPAGGSLPPGTYQVTVRGGGREITATGSVAPPAGPAQPSTGNGGGLLLGLLAILLAGAVAAGAVLAVRGPARRNREFQRLAALIAEEEYAPAVAGLTRIEAQLPPARRAQARFYLAFGLYQLGDLDEAEHRLAALHREQPGDDEVAYLLAYLRVQRRDFDGAEPALAALASRSRLGVGEARRLYGVVTFQRATQAVANGRIDAAAELFEQVGRLGDFRDRIPADLRNRHVALGSRALLDGDVPAARVQFEELAKAATGADLRASALLGLALTGWVENEPGGAARVHKLLSECLQLLDPDGPLSRPWPGPPSEQVEDRILEVRAGARRPPEELDRRRTLRDVHLLRAMALLRAVGEAQRPAVDARRLLAGAAQRLACVIAQDPTIADPYLVVGLLRYRLATDPAATRQAVAELRAAQTLGARDAVLLQILHRHEHEARARRAAWDRYADGGGDTAGNTAGNIAGNTAGGTAGGTLREDARQRMTRFGRVPNLDGSPDAVPSARGAPPTVSELRDRADLLAARLRSLGTGPDTAELAARLEANSAALGLQARTFEEAEADALARFGDRLLAEERGPS